jgi:hypothetical protein
MNRSAENLCPRWEAIKNLATSTPTVSLSGTNILLIKN